MSAWRSIAAPLHVALLYLAAGGLRVARERERQDHSLDHMHHAVETNAASGPVIRGSRPTPSNSVDALAARVERRLQRALDRWAAGFGVTSGTHWVPGSRTAFRARARTCR